MKRELVREIKQEVTIHSWVVLLGVSHLLLSLDCLPAFAAKDWCIENKEVPPCGGAPGKCTKNRDGSEGGFVANSAHVQQRLGLWLNYRNVPHLDKFVQICGSAQVSGDSRILDRAMIQGSARVTGFAQVGGSAQVFDSAHVDGYSQVLGQARVRGQAVVEGNAIVTDHAELTEEAHVYQNGRVSGHARIAGQALINGRAQVLGEARVNGTARVRGVSRVFGGAHVSGNSHIFGDSEVSGNAWVAGDSRVYGRAQVYGNARLLEQADVSQRALVFEDAEISGAGSVAGTTEVRGSTVISDRTAGTGPVENVRGGLSKISSAAFKLDKFLADFDLDHPAAVENKPKVSHRAYSNSEAEVLNVSHTIRVQTNAWQDTVCLNGKKFGIAEKDIPQPQHKAFTILDPELARETGQCVGDSLSQNQIENHPAVASLMNALTDANLMRVDPAAINPAYHARPVSQEEQTYIDYLRLQIKLRLDGLKKVHGGSYSNDKEIFGAVYLHGLGEDEGALGQQKNSKYHRDTFIHLSDAIKENNEKKFIENLTKLATLFDYRHLEAQSALVDSFTVLYVTKEFPSEGIRQNYYHFVLRCGHMH